MRFQKEELEWGRCPLCPSPAVTSTVQQFDEFSYQRCHCCDIWYLNPHPKESVIKNLYSSKEYFKNKNFGNGYQTYEQDKRYYLKTFHRRVKVVQRFIQGNKGAVLDVGCGLGYMLEVLERFGYEGWGIDFPGYALKNAAIKYGDRIVSIDHATKTMKKNYYTAIWLTDVIEHIYNPQQALNDYHSWLKKGGIVAIITPANDSWLARLSGRRWVSFKIPEHIFLYGTESLKQLVNPFFEILAIRSVGQYVSGGFLYERLYRLIPALKRPLEVLLRCRPIKQAMFYVPSGSIMCIARKRS